MNMTYKMIYKWLNKIINKLLMLKSINYNNR